MTALRDYVAKKNNSSATTDGFGGTKLRDYVSKTGSSLDEARKRIQERDKIYAKNEVIRRSQEEATKYSSEADYYNSIANAPGELLSGIKQQLKESAAAGTDIVSRLSPIEPMRNAVSGIREAKRLSGTVPISVAYQKGYEESRGRETLFEKVSGEKLTKEDGNINWPAARNFIVSGAEIPTLGFSTAFKSVGGNILKRIVQRTIKSTPEIAVNTALQQAEQMNTENIGTNLLANTLLISGLGNIGGEIRYKGNIAKGVEKVEAETGKLSVQDQYDLVDAIKNGADPDELAMNAGRIKRGEISAKEVNDKISEPFNETGVTDEISTLNERIANSNDSDEIASLIKGRVSDNDLPTISRTLKTVSDEGTVARILDEYNPEKLKEELALKIATIDNEKKIAAMLKGQVSETDIPTVSRVLKGVEDETEVAKILDEFRIKEIPKIESPEVPKVEPIKNETPTEKQERFNKENTEKISASTLSGTREEYRLSSDEAIEKFSRGIDKGSEKVTVYRAGTGEIKPGEYVSTSKENVEANYSGKGDIYEKQVNVSDLVYGNGKKIEHIYAPKESIVQKEPSQQKAPAKNGAPNLKEKSKTNKSGLVKTLQNNAEARGVELKKEDVPRLAAKMKLDDESKKAFNVYAEDPDKAIEMATRGEAPEGVRAGSLYTVVRDAAILENDVDTLYRLRTSKEAIETAAEAGREVKAYDSALRSDPVKIMREIDDLKVKIAERSGVDAKEEVKTALNELKSAIAKESSGDDGFVRLINAIKC